MVQVRGVPGACGQSQDPAGGAARVAVGAAVEDTLPDVVQAAGEGLGRAL